MTRPHLLNIYKHLWFLVEIKNNFPPWSFLSTTICILRCIGKDWRGIELDMSLFVFQGNILIFFVLRRSSPAFRIEDSIGSPCKVIYPKYSKYWPYLLIATWDCICGKILNHRLFLSLFKFFGWKYILNWDKNLGLKSRFIYVLFKI